MFQLISLCLLVGIGQPFGNWTEPVFISLVAQGFFFLTKVAQGFEIGGLGPITYNLLLALF